MLVAAGMTLMVREQAIADRVTAHLQLRPISQSQMFAALQALSVAGRHVGISCLVSIPMVLLVATLISLPPCHGSCRGAARDDPLDGAGRDSDLQRRAAKPQRSDVARDSDRHCRLTGVVDVLLRCSGSNSGAAPECAGSNCHRWPHLYLVAHSCSLGGAVDGLALSWNSAQRSMHAGSISIPVVPAWVRGLSRLWRVVPTLLHSELLRLIRWRRFVLGWMAGSAFIVMLWSRADLTSGRIVFPVILLRIPSWIVDSVMANVFAPDMRVHTSPKARIDRQ